MIKRKHTNNYEHKMRSIKVEYSTAASMYCTNHDVKVPFCMPAFSSSKIINHRFHVDIEKGKPGIGYDISIGRDLMVQLGLTADFKRQVLQWDGATINMKGPRSLLGKSDLTKREMREVVMLPVEPTSTKEGTEHMVKILNSTYVEVNLKKVADNSTQLNSEEITLLLSLLEDFEECFDDTLGDWATELLDLELKLDSKTFNSR